jgi:hypothetical protein
MGEVDELVIGFIFGEEARTRVEVEGYQVGDNIGQLLI